jgi:hypothetical protein
MFRTRNFEAIVVNRVPFGGICKFRDGNRAAAAKRQRNILTRIFIVPP